MTNTNRDIPINSINNQTVHAVQIVDYLNWAAHSEEYKEILALPAIQRGFVWKPKQIQDLWDTLLRGMPVGSLLVQKFDQNKLSRSINDGEEQLVKKQSSAGWYLLDGQQRTLSMLLGFPNGVESAHKLWVNFSEDGLPNNLKYQFRVTTEHQPFGYQTDGKRLSLNNRRKARAAYDSDENLTNQEIFNKAKPWQSSKDKQKYIFLVSELWKLMDNNGDDLGTWQKKVIGKIEPPIDNGITKRINPIHIETRSLI